MSGRRATAALALSTTAGYGVLFYAYGVLLVPMQRDLHWSRSFLSGAFSAALVVSALLTVPVGRWLDRHEPRPLFVGTAIVASLAVAAWAAARSRPVYALVWLALGGCQAVLFYDPAFVVLAKRFDGASRTRAITSVTLLAGLASTIFAPTVALLDRLLGWRGAVRVLAVVLLIATVPPLATSLGPHVSELPDPSDEGHGVDSVPRDVFRTWRFWGVSMAYVLSAVTTFGVAVHLVPFLISRGLPAGTAATALGGIGLVQVLGRGSYLRLSAGRRSIDVATWVLAAKAVGLGVLLALPLGLGVALFVVVYGAANGVATLTRPTTVAELYGPRHYGAIAGAMAAMAALAGALAPFGAAVAIDRVGSARPVLLALAGLSLVAAGINQAVARSVRLR